MHKERMTKLDFEVGKLYGDSGGVEMLFFTGESFLYDFVEAAYDDEKQDYFPTDNQIRLTAREAKELVRW